MEAAMQRRMASLSSDSEGSSAEDITFPPEEDAVPSGLTGTTGVSTSTALASTGETTDDQGDGDDSSEDCSDAPPSHEDDDSQRTEHDEYRRTHGTCTYYPTDDNHPCQVQRSCYDCMNFNITSEPGGCMVNSIGVCVSASAYDPALDFRLGQSSNDDANNAYASMSNGNSTHSGADNGNSATNSQASGDSDDTDGTSQSDVNQRFDFLASDATYCEDNDAQCAVCRSTAFADIMYHHSDTSRSKYCLGQNGCVCVAICEARAANPPKLAESCMVNTMSSKQEKNPTQYGSIAAILGAMVFVVVSVFVIYRIRKRGEHTSSSGSTGASHHSEGHRRGSDDDGNVVITPEAGSSPIVTATPVIRPGSGSGLLLNLFGWTAMREVLIQKEQLHNAGVNDAAATPVKNSNVQFLGTEPSAPDVEAAMPTAPSAIPVATLAMASAPLVMTVRAMAAPSAPDFEDMDSVYSDDVDMAEL